MWSIMPFAQRRRLSSQRHEEIWLWSVETPSWQTALAGCAWESHLQARPHDVPLFARTSTSVPRLSYQASHRSCIATLNTFCQPTPANRTPLSTQHVRPSGFSSCWSDSLELAARWTQREIQRVTLTVSNSSLKQSCSVSTSVTSALEVNFNNMHYINLHFTYLLTYRLSLCRSVLKIFGQILRSPIFLFNSRVIPLDNAIDRLSISQSAPEIFAVKVKSCLTSRQILDVFCLPKF